MIEGKFEVTLDFDPSWRVESDIIAATADAVRGSSLRVTEITRRVMPFGDDAATVVGSFASSGIHPPLHPLVPVTPSKGDDPMAVNVTVDINLFPHTVPDAVTLGAFVDEIRGYVRERIKHYGFAITEQPTVNIDMPA